MAVVALERRASGAWAHQPGAAWTLPDGRGRKKTEHPKALARGMWSGCSGLDPPRGCTYISVLPSSSVSPEASTGRTSRVAFLVFALSASVAGSVHGEALRFRSWPWLSDVRINLVSLSLEKG